MLARFLPRWQGITNPRRGLDGLLDVVEQLQGLAVPASVLEQEILPARVENFLSSELDELCSAGEVVWRGLESLGPGDGRVALYLTDHFLTLARPGEPADGNLQGQIRELLASRERTFFDDIAKTIGGFRNDALTALWDLVWAGEVTNDTLAPLRSLRRDKKPDTKSRARRGRRVFRSRRTSKTPGSEGRWSLLVSPGTELPSTTEHQTALAAQLVERYGILTREMVGAEGVTGGFSGLYPVLKAMEEAGKIRRGYFVAGLGAAQFAAAGAEDRLREVGDFGASRESDGQIEEQQVVILAATDPANPYGSALRWPERDESARPQRTAGARVFLHEGKLAGYLGRTGQHLMTFVPRDEPDRGRTITALIAGLLKIAQGGQPVYLTRIDGGPTGDSVLSSELVKAGFVPTTKGFLLCACLIPKVTNPFLNRMNCSRPSLELRSRDRVIAWDFSRLVQENRSESGVAERRQVEVSSHVATHAAAPRLSMFSTRLSWD